MKAIILRFTSPIMSFGSTQIDAHGYTDFYPGASMLAGLIASALGYTHRDAEKTAVIQRRLKYAARWDTVPVHGMEYQTVDLSDPRMLEGWTTRGKVEGRTGDPKNRTGRHIRYRYILQDGQMTVAISIDDEDLFESSLKALQKPARPIFIGRKPNIPTRPLVDPYTPILEGNRLVEILRDIPPLRDGDRFYAVWPAEEGVPTFASGRRVRRFELRDWKNNIMSGSRMIMEGVIRRVYT